MKALSTKNLRYSYPDGSAALSNVSIDVEEGELVALLGPNGAGKSTLLLHLNGLLRGEGAVEVFGEDIREKNRRTIISEVGIVFQNPDDQLFMPTVFDDVAFGPLNMGLGEQEVRMRVTDALEKVGMLGYEKRAPHNLSLGQKKKVAIATILSMDPKIVVFDEPTPSLDPSSTKDILRIIKDLKSRGRTVIVATHDVSSVPEIADRIYVLDKEVIGHGTPREVFMRQELLTKARLEVPVITKLFEMLSCFGYNYRDLPLSFDEAVAHLTESIETGGGHIHLHMHEHTHEKIEKVREKHDHHIGEKKP